MHLPSLVNWGWICIGCNFYNAFANCRSHRFFTGWGKSAFKSGLSFLRSTALFSNLSFFLVFRPNPYPRMCVLTIGSFSLFGKQVQIIVKHKSNLGLFGFLRFSISRFISIISSKCHQINKIHVWQMRFKCYTRYKSNPIYKIGQIKSEHRNPPIF